MAWDASTSANDLSKAAWWAALDMRTINLIASAIMMISDLAQNIRMHQTRNSYSMQRSQMELGVVTVRVGQSMSNCGHTPRLWRMLFISVETSIPSTNAMPPLLLIIPVSMEMVVVLPAPLWPSKHVICNQAQKETAGSVHGSEYLGLYER